MLLVIYVLVLHSLYFLLSVSCLLELVHLCSLMYSYIHVCVCVCFLYFVCILLIMDTKAIHTGKRLPVYVRKTN